MYNTLTFDLELKQATIPFLGVRGCPNGKEGVERLRLRESGRAFGPLK